jgi:hypothetical protein
MTIKYIHLRRRHPLYGTLEATGGVTVAYELTGEPPDPVVFNPNRAPRMVEYTYAICSPKDHYTRKIGRDIARGRLVTEHQQGVHSFPYVEGVNVVEQIIKHHDDQRGK